MDNLKRYIVPRKVPGSRSAVESAIDLSKNRSLKWVTSHSTIEPYEKIA